MIGRFTFALAVAAAMASPALADRALVIGIDRYSDPKLDIGGGSSGNDVEKIVGTLRGNAMGYDAGDIRILQNGDATRQAILAGIEEWLIAGTAPGERAFFYYSGLGHFQADDSGDEKDGLDETIVPTDATVTPGDPPAIGGAILDDELIELFTRLNDRKLTVVVDAGHSGLVSGGPAKAAPKDNAFRVASLGTTVTRSIVVEPKAKAQKAEGAPLDTEGLGPDAAVFTATSGGQAPIIEGGEGAFTKAFVEAVEGGADKNGNGVVSNAEILGDIREKSEASCAGTSGCELGLTPTLGPETAAGGSPAAEAPSSGGDRLLTADQVLDYFGKGNTHGVTMEQYPPSPVKVGTRDIRFRVSSPVEGNLVLLDLSDDGTLTQLFPNEHIEAGGREGYILAGSSILVPDDYYGIRFNATSPNSGTLIALVTDEPIELPPSVKTRKIEVIPKGEAKEVYLPAIAAALDAPVDAAADTPTRNIDWSVATMRYEIVH
jgi:metacaspase-1